jgi:hypothetical protein
LFILLIKSSILTLTVNLEEKTCSCSGWQVSRKPCSHSLATIGKVSGEVNMEDFVHDYFSVQRFMKAYEGTFKPMISQEQWPRVNLGYKLKKPKLRRKPGRSRVSRIKGSDELGKKKKRKCSECNELGQRHRLSSIEQSNGPIPIDASK